MSSCSRRPRASRCRPSPRCRSRSGTAARAASCCSSAAQCGRIIWIPEATCRWCGSDEYTWERGEGKGEIYSWSSAWRPVSPAFSVPYVAVIVSLDEGYRILSNLVGCEVDDAARRHARRGRVPAVRGWHHAAAVRARRACRGAVGRSGSLSPARCRSAGCGRPDGGRASRERPTACPRVATRSRSLARGTSS